MPYNPFDLFPLELNKQLIYGRPIELDSDITDKKRTTNAFGYLVKPKRVTTTCPGCATPLIIELRDIPDPPFNPVKIACQKCSPAPLPPPDPFISPVERGLIILSELNPVMGDIKERSEDGLTVMERIQRRQAARDPFPIIPLVPMLPAASEPDLVNAPAHVNSVNDVLEETDDMGEEVEFDDDDFLEDV